MTRGSSGAMYLAAVRPGVFPGPETPLGLDLPMIFLECGSFGAMRHTAERRAFPGANGFWSCGCRLDV